MFQGPLCPNLSQKVQKEVSQMANHNLSCVILLGGLSVNLNHLKTQTLEHSMNQYPIVTVWCCLNFFLGADCCDVTFRAE